MAKIGRWMKNQPNKVVADGQQSVAVEDLGEEKEYTLEELLENAYVNYRDSVDVSDLLNRREFREQISDNHNMIREYLPDNQYAAYMKILGDADEAVRKEKPYIPENNPDASDEALEILSNGLEDSVKAIMKETEPEDEDMEAEAAETETEGMLTPEPNYRAAAGITVTSDEPAEACEPENMAAYEEPLQEEVEEESKEIEIEDTETGESEPGYTHHISRDMEPEREDVLNEMKNATEEADEKHTDMAENELEYIFNNKELLANLRRSVYCDPNDASMDDDLKKMNLDELFEQLLRINGVTRKIPAIIENVHQLYLKRIENVETEIPRERLEELLLYAIELIRKDNHMEYGDCLNTYLGTQIGMTTEELEKMNVANGRGGYERVTLCVRTNDGDNYYEIEAPYDQAEKVFRKYQMCMADDVFVNPVAFFGCFGISVLHLDGELDSKATFEEDRICI